MLVATIVTGLVVELALIPMALFHFHRSGLYGVAANIVAIPLTTFVIMPLEAGALLLDAVGWGRPLWFLCGTAIDVLLWIAHAVAAAKGAVAMLPSMPGWAFGLMVAGGLWLCLWQTRLRLLGVAPFVAGAMGAAFTPAPDLLRDRRWPPPRHRRRWRHAIYSFATALAITSAIFSPKLRASTATRWSSVRGPSVPAPRTRASH